MDFIYNLVVLVHLLAMALLVGAYVATLKAPRVSEPMVWGARLVFLSGVALMGMREAIDSLDKPDLIMAKMIVKLVIALAVVACAEIARAKQKRNEPAVNLVHAAGGLAIINVVIAVLWTS